MMGLLENENEVISESAEKTSIASKNLPITKRLPPRSPLRPSSRFLNQPIRRPTTPISNSKVLRSASKLIQKFSKPVVSSKKTVKLNENLQLASDTKKRESKAIEKKKLDSLINKPFKELNRVCTEVENVSKAKAE